MLAAGLEGIEKGYKLPNPIEMDIFDLSNKEKKKMGIDSLPGSLAKAIEITEKSEVVRKALGDHVFNGFIANKKIEWDEYRTHVHPYELNKYLSIL
jgi:glutamine synthetase